MYKSLEERLLSGLTYAGDCWLSSKDIIWNGYSRLTVKGKHVLAHRVSYKIFKGNIPKGLLVLHNCDIRNCINPYHLWAGSKRDNSRDMIAKGRYRKYSFPQSIYHWHSKLTAAKLRMIKRLRGKEKQKTIARLVGVSPQTINGIFRGRSNHVL